MLKHQFRRPLAAKQASESGLGSGRCENSLAILTLDFIDALFTGNGVSYIYIYHIYTHLRMAYTNYLWWFGGMVYYCFTHIIYSFSRRAIWLPCHAQSKVLLSHTKSAAPSRHNLGQGVWARAWNSAYWLIFEASKMMLSMPPRHHTQHCKTVSNSIK